MIRFFFLVVNLVYFWDNEVFFLDDFFLEIIFWKNNVVFLNGKVYWLFYFFLVKVMYLDVFNLVCGVFVENFNLVFYQNWFFEESVKSFIWREFRVVFFVVEVFVNYFFGFKVIWYIDN